MSRIIILKLVFNAFQDVSIFSSHLIITRRESNLCNYIWQIILYWVINYCVLLWGGDKTVYIVITLILIILWFDLRYE